MGGLVSESRLQSGVDLLEVEWCGVVGGPVPGGIVEPAREMNDSGISRCSGAESRYEWSQPLQKLLELRGEKGVVEEWQKVLIAGVAA